MTQTISRLYDSHDTAEAAKAALQKRGLNEGHISIVARQDATSPDGVEDVLKRAGVPAAHASIYAEGIQRGQTLLVVRPHFGSSQPALQTLESFKPINTTVPDLEPAATSSKTRDNAAPLSSALGWRVLLDDPAPLSNYFKWRTLKPEPENSKTLERIQAESKDPAPLSRKIGMKTLSDNPAPLSSKLGWKTLSEKAAPLSEKVGWRVLLDDPAPLSRKIGWAVLSSSPTPLSDKLGWRTLSERPAPLSSSVSAPPLLHDAPESTAKVRSEQARTVKAEGDSPDAT